MNKNYYAIIMAGGIGSRFWPISRTSHPKQFIDILGTGKTLIQNTYERFLKVCPKENIYVVTNENYTKVQHDFGTGIFLLPRRTYMVHGCRPSQASSLPLTDEEIVRFGSYRKSNGTNARIEQDVPTTMYKNVA